MREEEALTPAERELETALKGLSPARPTIDRDRMIFLAGRASARRRGRIWQGAAGALAACLVLTIALRPGPREIVPIEPTVARPAGLVAAPDPAPGRSEPPPPTGQYITLRAEVLAGGLDVLAETEPSLPAEPAVTLREVFNRQSPIAANGSLFGKVRALLWPGGRP